MEASVVKGLHYGNDINSINRIGAWIRKYGDQDMLFHVERPWVKWKWPFCHWNPDGFCRESRCHQFSDWKNNNLSRDRWYGEWILTIAKELIQEGQQTATSQTQNPCSEGQSRQCWIISDWNSQSNLFDRTIVLIWKKKEKEEGYGYDFVPLFMKPWLNMLFSNHNKIYDFHHA